MDSKGTTNTSAAANLKKKQQLHMASELHKRLANHGLTHLAPTCWGGSVNREEVGIPEFGQSPLHGGGINSPRTNPLDMLNVDSEGSPDDNIQSRVPSWATKSLSVKKFCTHNPSEEELQQRKEMMKALHNLPKTILGP